MAMRSLFHRAPSPPALSGERVEAEVPDLHDANLAAVYYGHRQGGDFYDFVRVTPDRVVFGLLDVAGRVEDNRTIISATQQRFRTLAPELFALEEVNEADAMVRLCLELNRTVLTSARGVHSCPAFAGCYNETLGTVCYFNAGHTPGLVRDGTGVAELGATGLPLGLFSHTTCDAPMVALEPAAALLLVSRGILEGKCNDEEFGLERVKQGLQRSAGGNAKEVCVGLFDKVREFMCKPPTHNDVTALALVREASRTGPPRSAD